MLGKSNDIFYVTLKFRYKPIVSNDFIDETTLTKKGKITGKYHCMRFFFCRVYVSINIFLFLVLLCGAKMYILEEIQNMKDKRRKSNIQSTKAKTQNIEDKIQKTKVTSLIHKLKTFHNNYMEGSGSATIK